jgi:AGCS family alanine or glycine:cation symporter
MPQIQQSQNGWSFSDTHVQGDEWRDAEPVLLIVDADANAATGQSRHRISGSVNAVDEGFVITWQAYPGTSRPKFTSDGFYKDHVGATLTAKAFDTVTPGLGKWLITISSWLFAISTIIAWGYYGEQGVIYIFGGKGVLPFNIVYCTLTFVATLGHIKTSADLDNLTGIGLGVIIYTNLPILWIFGYQAMRAYKNYIARLKSGQLDSDEPPPSLDELLGPARD